jgi:hypothetical protein
MIEFKLFNRNVGIVWIPPAMPWVGIDKYYDIHTVYGIGLIAIVITHPNR